jgi:hypothetical protein
MVSIEDDLCQNCGEKFQEHPEIRAKKREMHAEIKRGAGSIISVVTIVISLSLLITILMLDNLHRWIRTFHPKYEDKNALERTFESGDVRAICDPDHLVHRDDFDPIRRGSGQIFYFIGIQYSAGIDDSMRPRYDTVSNFESDRQRKKEKIMG